MERKKLTRTINTKTAEGQEEALRALQEQLEQPVVETQPIVEQRAPLNTYAETVVEPRRMAAPRQERNAPPSKVAKPTAPKRDVKRINMDIPTDLNDLIEAEIEETGQTVKGFFVMLARQYFRNR
jgi:hypothetical protein